MEKILLEQQTSQFGWMLNSTDAPFRCVYLLLCYYNFMLCLLIKCVCCISTMLVLFTILFGMWSADIFATSHNRIYILSQDSTRDMLSMRCNIYLFIADNKNSLKVNKMRIIYEIFSNKWYSMAVQRAIW